MIRPLPIILLVFAAGAQESAPAPSYYAASIKQDHSGSNGMGGMVGIKNGGELSMRNIPVRMLISIAYELPDYAISSTPSWTSSAGYDIEAKPESAVDDKTAHRMFQQLLAERFGLRAHREAGMISGFNLVADRGVTRLKPSEAKGIGFRIQSMEEIQGPGDMEMLARTLKGILRVPVEDHTGIAGKFDIELKWTPDGPPRNSDGGAPEPVVPIFAAIREQLGLSLEKTQVPIDRLVIDKVERPSEN